MQARLNDVLTRMKQAVESSSGYWVAADGDRFRTDFAGWVDTTETKLSSVLQEAATITRQNLGAIQQATESNQLAPYWQRGNLLGPKWGNLLPDSMSHLDSNEEGSLYYGTAGYLFSKYGVGHRLLLPGSADTPWAVVPRVDKMPAPAINDLGKGWVKSDSGLYVPAGSKFDPNLPPPTDDLGSGWKTGTDSGFRFDPVNVPKWATAGSYGLAAVGAGLSLYGAWDQAWQNDQALHPNWSLADRIADAGGQSLVIGGSSILGGWAGAEVGAETGAEIGAGIGSIIPGAGTVVGGLVGGLVGGIGGGFVGGQLGQAVGESIWDFGKTAVQAVSGVAGDVDQGLSDAGNAIGQGLSDAGNAVGQGLSDAGDAIGQGLSDVGSFIGGIL